MNKGRLAVIGPARAAILALMVMAGVAGARAEDYPTRTVTIIVPFAAGGPADITGRIVADIFSRHLGQKFLVENVVGAGGTTGTLRAAKATADGYTLISGHLGTNALAPRSEEHTSELQSRSDIVCRLLLE